jgi:hypothetical protein
LGCFAATYVATRSINSLMLQTWSVNPAFAAGVVLIVLCTRQKL